MRMNENDQRAFDAPDSPREAAASDNAVFRKAVKVPDRSEGESLDDYLNNINSYLNDLNRRLGEIENTSRPAPPAAPAPDRQPGLTDEPSGAFREAASFSAGPVPSPYGHDVYAERVRSYGAASNWQAAVANPELYPDLDDPAVTRKRRGLRRRRKSSGKVNPAPYRAQTAVPGKKNGFAFVMTLINLCLYAGWSVAYFICDICRNVMLANAQSQMAAQGFTEYTLVISSPVFTVLKVLLYLMPVVLIMWMAGVLSSDKKQLELPDKRLLIGACAVDIFTGILAVVDVFAVRLILG